MNTRGFTVAKQNVRNFRKWHLPCQYVVIVVVLTTSLVTTARSQISLGSGFSYSQNFDSMGTTGTTTTPTGWTVDSLSSASGAAPLTTGSVGTNKTAAPSTGTSSSGGNYNFGFAGTNPNTDRALGSLATGNLQRDTYVSFVNNTGTLLNSFSVIYDGEQWRTSDTAPGSLTLQISTDGSSWTNMGSTYNFAGPNTTTSNTGTAAAVDGNASANRTAGIGGIYTLSSGVADGSNFYLRWADTDDPGLDAALAIDNFSITAVPEPATMLGGLLLVIAAGWMQRRRRFGLRQPAA